MMREVMSAPPPGANGLIQRIGLAGQAADCAASVVENISHGIAASNTRRRKIMMSPENLDIKLIF